jgi:hypothetical protein
MMSKRTRLIAAGVLAASALTAGCSSPQLKDLGGTGQANPDYIITYLNVSEFPNITLVCIKGVGFATTTRDYEPLTRIPQWDAFCATKEPASGQPIPTQSPATTG